MARNFQKLLFPILPKINTSQNVFKTWLRARSPLLEFAKQTKKKWIQKQPKLEALATVATSSSVIGLDVPEEPFLRAYI